MLAAFYHILFIISFLALLHSYVIYPLLIKFLSYNKKNNTLTFTENDDDLPQISIIMSAYNEEKVILDKLNSLLLAKNNLLSPKINIFIGSDASADNTNNIIQSFVTDNPFIHFFPFTERRGKPSVVNDLVHKANTEFGKSENHILIITDASVMLSENTVFQLIKHFKNKDIALVDSNQMPIGIRKEGISHSETTYLRREVQMKHQEGIIWQMTLGPLGGCYALRSDYFSPVPSHYLVDDFYIAMRVFEQNGYAINELNAVCYEAVSHEIAEEYRRKRRIAAGNFQNLRTFFPFILERGGALLFVFLSHKILRWLGPFFIMFCFISSFYLYLKGYVIYKLLLLAFILGFILLPILDKLLSFIKINIPILRGGRYFVLMNIAMLEGFFKYIKGIKSGIWQPPKR